MRLIAIIILVFGFINVHAQDRSIKFEEGKFQEALEKAKKDGKLLFVDCYTSWCGPCKMLAREVFTNNEVADYFNKNFISFKVDCEKGEGPELRTRFNVSGYPTMVFINEHEEIVLKIVGARRQPAFLKDIIDGLNPEKSLYGKEKKYNEGCRDKAFLLDLIDCYKDINESQKARRVSFDLLSQLDTKEVLSKEFWPVVSYFYVSTYGSEWWNFIMEHSDEYEALVGKQEVARKVGETLYPYLFGYIYGRKKATQKNDFKIYKTIIDKYQPANKDILYSFIEIGRSASFDSHDKYVKTVLKVVPKMQVKEHYRFFSNAMKFLLHGISEKQKSQLLNLVKFSESQQNAYIKTHYQKFFKQIEEN